jgi:hypothetical protein
MPLGNVIGEFTASILSIKQTDLGGGQVRIELDTAGESAGQVPGKTFATLVAVMSAPGRPNPYSVTGTLLAALGALVRFSSWGVGMRTGEGHKVRLRGALCYATDDPHLASINGMLAAVEAEVDPAAMTIKGAGCEWT